MNVPVTAANNAPTPAVQTTASPAPQSGALVTRFAEKYHVDANKLLSTLKATCFRQSGDKVISNEQMMALLVVADQYGLNPFTKEIFAFEDKGNIIPVVSVDGWTRIINSHPMYDGIEFNYANETIKPDAKAKDCPIWCEAVIFRKDRSRTTVIREYLDEVYVPPRGAAGYAGPWQSHTKRMLRHKTLIQGARLAFGFAGIYDEDEAIRIINADVVQDATGSATKAGFDDFTKKLESASAKPADPVVIDGDFVQAELEDVPVVQREEPVNTTGAPTFDEAKRGIENAETLEQLDDAGALLPAFKSHPEHKEVTRNYLQRRTELIDK